MASRELDDVRLAPKRAKPVPTTRFAAVYLLLVVAAYAAPTTVFGETVTSEGTASVWVRIKRAGDACVTGATDTCKVGQLCFGAITVTGGAAKVLYEALKVHGIKHTGCCGDYVGTQTDSMTCYQDEQNKTYTCQIGYDGLSNKIIAAPACQSE
jgi:hypothetical protein